MADSKSLSSPDSHAITRPTRSLALELWRRTSVIVIAAMVGIGTGSLWGYFNNRIIAERQDREIMTAREETNLAREQSKRLQRYIEEQGANPDSSKLLFYELEELRWERLEEAWKELSEHASVEEEMKNWLESHFSELQARSQKCIGPYEQKILANFEKNAKSAIERAVSSSPPASRSDPRELLRFKKAKKVTLEWDAALLEICR